MGNPSPDSKNRPKQSPPGSKGPVPPGGKGPAGTPPANRNVLWFVLIASAIFLVLMLTSSGNRGKEIVLNDFETLYKNGQIEPDSVVIHESSVTALRKPDPITGKPATVIVTFNPTQSEYYTKRIMEITGQKAVSKVPSVWLQYLMSFAPFLILMMLVWFFIARGLRGAGGGPGGMLGSFGKSKHRIMNKEMTGVTFDDVAGIDEAKEEVGEIIEFLKNPKKFTKLGGRIPRGVLLVGKPGCGKTLLAKAIAGEADVPFFSISGSDFVEMFVGVGASRVRDLFKSAKENAPCIIFLDEIDAVGRKRGSGFSSGGHDEREQTLNAILVEMDGFTSTDGVIVIAATNRADVLDPALIRPGRFDRQIIVPLPDVKGRLEILKVHAKKVKLGPNVDLERLARVTPMFSGADLAAVINEAAISATMQNKDFIEQEDLEEARDKIRFGRARKSRVREAEENLATAYHEAGHAIIQALLKDADPVHKVTIIPRGEALGATFSMPEKDRVGYSRKYIHAFMRVACGGRIAEERATGDISSGAAGDISQVTNFARVMIEQWGMSERLGFVLYDTDDKDRLIADKPYSEETAKIIDEEVRRLVDEAYQDAQKILFDNWQKVEDVAQALLKYETLTGDEVHQLMRGEPISRSSLADLLNKERNTPPGNAAAGNANAETDDKPDTPPGLLPSPA